MMECDKNALFVVVVVCGCLCGSSLGKDARTERVIFENGSLKLLGDLLIPSGSGPHPAVVIVHGSGGSDRNGPGGYYRLTAEHFQAQGFVVLTFDKRGVGDSAGEWRTASFATLASDAAAGFRFLRLRPEVDTQKAGPCRFFSPRRSRGVMRRICRRRRRDQRFAVTRRGSVWLTSRRCSGRIWNCSSRSICGT